MGLHCLLRPVTMIDLETLGQGHTKCCPVPSTSCDLSSTKFEVATFNGLGGDTFTRNVTDRRTEGRTDRCVHIFRVNRVQAQGPTHSLQYATN